MSDEQATGCDQPQPGENAEESRNPDGTFKPGNPFAFDGSKPGPGRPPKDAWVRELEQQLLNAGLRKALSARIVELALVGSEKVAIQALKEIQDRTGGPVVREVKTEVSIVPHEIVLKDRQQPEPGAEENT